MKRSITISVLLLLLALIPGAQSSAAPAPSASATAPPASDAAFLATLALPGVQPLDPTPMSTACNSNADCPSGKLCCYPCGIDGCSNICMTPVKGRCPLFV